MALQAIEDPRPVAELARGSSTASKSGELMAWLVAFAIVIFCCAAPFLSYDSRDGRDWSSPLAREWHNELVGNRVHATSRLGHRFSEVRKVCRLPRARHVASRRR
jgi:hypothetical protein